MSNAMKALAILSMLGLAAMAHAAQVYEWVDEKGVKQYTQQPPPPNIKKAQEKRLGANVVETSGQTYTLKQAAKNFPVTLYVTDCGDPCTKARAHLAKRGVPFKEKDPQKAEEIDNFKKLTGGGMEVPLLVVGELRTLKGYLASEWDAAFDQAGYPSAAVPGGVPAATPPAAGK
jgi:glutaredoxin